LSGVPEGPFGFHVQQAVEKLLKALLSQLSIEYKLIHELDYLTAQLKDAGEILPDTLVDFSKIDTFAVRNRYDELLEFHVLDRAAAIETVRLIREHVVARIAPLRYNRHTRLPHQEPNPRPDRRVQLSC
jgi:hypothetical protein